MPKFLKIQLLFLFTLFSLFVRAQKNKLLGSPHVTVQIALLKNTFKTNEPILLNIKLINNSKEDQKLLFDKPESSTGGPWYTTGKVFNKKTNQSVLKSENKAMMGSTAYTENDLEGKYYHLLSGQSVSKKYNLTDIVIYNTSNNQLPKGTYSLQIFYYSIPSNIILFTVK